MLEELRVKNLALIKESELSFSKGLHILTGETGAGKSLLLGSVGLALGEKAGEKLVGHYGDQALSELVFSIDDEDVLKRLRELDIPELEDGQLILQRKISLSRSSCRINGETFPAGVLKSIAELLVDIHGQHENQSLLKKSNHRLLLDGFAGEHLSTILSDISKEYKIYSELSKKLEESSFDDMKRERDISLLEHEINEITQAALREGEDDECETLYRRMSNARRIAESLGLAAKLTGGETQASIGRALRELTSAAGYDEGLDDLVSVLSDVDSLMSDFSRGIADYIQELDFDEADFVKCERRLDEINQLKSKYGKTIELINEYASEAEDRLLKLKNYDEYIEGLRADYDLSKQRLTELSDKATSIRKDYAKELCALMETNLSELNFLKAKFEVQITPTGSFGLSGADDVEFMVSLNPGEPLMPLKDVASGGELSRIMLALRTVGASRDGIGTLIFDEIDAGISGRTAALVAKKLAKLATTRQVICITHLPQIASYADHHYLIEKSSDDETTTTSIAELNDEESLKELTRLLGDTQSSMATAIELKKEAAHYKSSNNFS